MKSSFRLLPVLAFIGLLGTSCNDYLNKIPDNRVVVNDEDKVRRLLVNAYPTATPALLGELSCDNTDDIGVNNPYFGFLNREAFYWQEIQEYGDTDGLGNIWTAHYSAINHANMALQYIETMPESDRMKALKGEALVARAYAHFVLVNLFSQHYNTATSAKDYAVPYMLKPETELDPKYERSNVAAFYAQIEKDLKEGLPLINDGIYSVEKLKYHMHRRAAYAFAARFYLFYEKWEEALAAANVVLGETIPASEANFRDWTTFRKIAADVASQANEYARRDSPSNLFLQSVWSVVFDALNRDYLSLRFSHSKRNSEYETFAATNIWGSGYDNYRIKIVVSDRSDIYSRVAFSKFPYFQSQSNGTTMIPFTTEETLLVRAEANTMLKKYDDAVSDLNVLTKAFLIKENTQNQKNEFTLDEITTFYNSLPYSAPGASTQKKRLNPKFAIEAGTQENLLHYILQCRRLVTMHEGLRWLDVRRYGIEIERYLHDTRVSGKYEVVDQLKNNDPRRALQLPVAVRSAGLAPNPR